MQNHPQKGFANIAVFIIFLLTMGGAVLYFKNFPLEKLPAVEKQPEEVVTNETNPDVVLPPTIVPSATTTPTVSATTVNVSQPKTTVPKKSVAEVSPKPAIQGRIIDVYPSGTVTVQAISGKEEVVMYKNVSSLKSGEEVNIFGKWDTEMNGSGEWNESLDIFYANEINPLTKGTLKFVHSMEEIDSRKLSAQTLNANGMHLVFGELDGNAKQAYMIFISPDGRMLAPNFAGIPGAQYTVQGSLATAQEALSASQYITIPFMAKGLWTVKIIPVKGADMSTVFGLDPGLPEKTLSERNEKLWYFKL